MHEEGVGSLEAGLQVIVSHWMWVSWNSRKQSVGPDSCSVALLCPTQPTPDDIMRLGVVSRLGLFLKAIKGEFLTDLLSEVLMPGWSSL